MTRQDRITEMAKEKARLDLASDGHATPEHYAEAMYATIEESLDKLFGALLLARGYVLYGVIVGNKERLADAVNEAMKDWS